MKPWNKHLTKIKLQVEKRIKQAGLKINKLTRKVNIWKNATCKWKNAMDTACDKVNI